jgi:hypothetical protein
VAQDYTVTALLTSLKRKGMLASNDETLNTTDFLALANDELQSYVVPIVMRVREEHFVYTADITLVSGTSAYPFPYRSIGGRARQIFWKQSDTDYIPMDRIEPDNENQSGFTTGGGTPTGYKLEGNNIVFIPSPTATGTIRVKYFIRPGFLVQTSAVGTITAFNTVAKTVTISSSPSTFTSSVLYDLVSAVPGFSSLAIDQVASKSSNVYTFTSALPGGLAIGDYLCLAGESPVPQIPVELHPLLSQRTTMKVLEALGDPRAAVTKSMADEMERNTLTLLTPRVEGATRVIINYNAPGWGRRHG